MKVCPSAEPICTCFASCSFFPEHLNTGF
jgi:hypothetical protein